MLAQGRESLGDVAYERHQPEQALLYQLVEAHYPALVDQLAQQGKSLPDHVHREFEDYLKCGRLKHGFLRVRCDTCHFERLVAFSCKKRGFCPSCGARRMAETAALLADEVFPDVPLRQWVISFPFPLRYLFAAHPHAMGKVLRIVYRASSTHLIHKAGFSIKDGATGAVTLIQRFGSALNLNIHFHTLFLDGVYVYRDDRPAVAVPRLSLSSTGKVLYTLKTPYRDGTTQVAFEPVDFIARLAALVPKPRVNLTRFHGVLAPNHRWRAVGHASQTRQRRETNRPY